MRLAISAFLLLASCRGGGSGLDGGASDADGEESCEPCHGGACCGRYEVCCEDTGGSGHCCPPAHVCAGTGCFLPSRACLSDCRPEDDGITRCVPGERGDTIEQCASDCWVFAAECMWGIQRCEQTADRGAECVFRECPHGQSLCVVAGNFHCAADDADGSFDDLYRCGDDNCLDLVEDCGDRGLVCRVRGEVTAECVAP